MSDLAIITDGTAAAVGLVLGLISMAADHCRTDGCLAPVATESRTELSVGQVVFDGRAIGEEAYLRRLTGLQRGPFQLGWGASVSDQGALWAGLGAITTYTSSDQRWFVQFHLMPGLYAAGRGPDLGGPVAFRSGIDLGWQHPDGLRISLAVDHRSNAGLYDRNPGLETVRIGVSVPLR